MSENNNSESKKPVRERTDDLPSESNRTENIIRYWLAMEELKKRHLKLFGDANIEPKNNFLRPRGLPPDLD